MQGTLTLTASICGSGWPSSLRRQILHSTQTGADSNPMGPNKAQIPSQPCLALDLPLPFIQEGAMMLQTSAATT